ncbi:MAG: LytTR family transcriptional regulator [Clostridia bacterium]|nr:LytTR family transcriptional regulator [Clostridia bacterium]
MRYEIIISSEEEERVVIYAKENTPIIKKIISVIEDSDRRIIGYRGEESVLFSQSEIECITVIDGKTTIVTEYGNFVLRERLYSLEEKLNDDFIRINKSTLANLKKIHSFSASFGGALMIKFKCGFCDYVSRRQQKAVKERLK